MYINENIFSIVTLWGEKMKVIQLQKQGYAINKQKGTLSRYGVVVQCFEDTRKISREEKFDEKKENKWFEELNEDFFDEDSE